MNAAATTSRGKPLVALAGIMACWVGIRIVMLQFDGMTLGPADEFGPKEASPFSNASPADADAASEASRPGGPAFRPPPVVLPQPRPGLYFARQTK